MRRWLARPLLVCVLWFPSLVQGAESVASDAINALGIDLLRVEKSAGNALISPYSIQSALAMTYAGADGGTLEAMTKTLHYPRDGSIHESFANLQKQLQSAGPTAEEQQRREKKASFEFVVANRLYGEKSFAFLKPFLDLVNHYYGAPLEPVDFINNAEGVRAHINQWVEEQTRDKIKDLLPAGSLYQETRLVLVNATYFKASWVNAFQEENTSARPFHLEGGSNVDVPTMRQAENFGYAKEGNYTVITLPYVGRNLQFLILMPDRGARLSEFEASLTGDMLERAAAAPGKRLDLYLPKLKIEPPLMQLSQALTDLGMGPAFDVPERSANFDRIAPRRPDEYLKISQVFHKTFLNLDETGTEAAAATAVAMVKVTMAPSKPEEVHVDRPFVFAIQHVDTGACLFLGRVTDPSK